MAFTKYFNKSNKKAPLFCSLNEDMNLLKLIYILIFATTTYLSHVSSAPKKKLYNDLLTEDNELLLIQYNTNNSPGKSSTHTQSQNASKHIALNTNKSTSRSGIESSSSSSKLIVNIVYASRLDENTPKSNMVSKKLVYLASSYSNPCDKNVCKSNETCVVVDQSQNLGYKCLARLGKATSKTATRIPGENSSAPKVAVRSRGCTSHGLIELKLKLYSQFDQSKRQNNDLKQSEITKINLIENFCVESIAHMLNLIDSNNDQQISRDEWSRLDHVIADKCSRDLFHTCDQDSSGKLSYKEFCKCFEGVEHKCKFMRNPLNGDTKQIYIKYLNEKFSITESQLVDKKLKELLANEKLPLTPRLSLSMTSYVPMCDVDGHFLAHQCDNRVNCWCVNKNGEPLLHTIKKIHENPYDCNFL